ncbi:hypothetical protein VTL71DRAFT_14574 [Oculimacula yallundae]|uniref:Uncharacterized protein n=1 Tax=Oculimacula yallundae TaxID=86028 RepID=A0ABR4CJG6_9HELO
MACVPSSKLMATYSLHLMTDLPCTSQTYPIYPPAILKQGTTTSTSASFIRRPQTYTVPPAKEIILPCVPEFPKSPTPTTTRSIPR